MNEPSLPKIEELFHRALKLPPGDRRPQLEAWCAGEPALRDEVLALLEADSSVEELMKDPWVGRSVGPYVLERVLGRGGMGVVYLAHRRDRELSQTVALKMIARHLRASPAVDQFLVERQALARLEHKHIARLLDGGVVDGAPYLIVEYIDGRRLDVVCDDPATPVVDKIGYLLQLCEAVAYVHRNLILHRDLKPGNVMVGADGQVKLLDFGTLKSLDGGGDSSVTQVGMRSMTLHYASPEYIAGHAVSTASDVYSLGVILYRIVAGRLPHELGEGGVERLLDAIRNTPPAGFDAQVHAPRQLRKDLSAIALQALRFVAADRYSGADALAADLRKALANRPVGARAGSGLYRAEKFWLRHRPALLGGAAVLLTAAVALLAIAHAGRAAAAATVTARAGVEDERSLAHLLLFDYFEQLKRIPGSTNAQRAAVSQALNYLDELAQSGPDAALQLDRVDAYTKMGNLLGSPYEENIGDGDRAIETLKKAVQLSRDLLARRPADLRYLQSSATAGQALGRVYFGSGDPQHAVEYLKAAAGSGELIAYTPGVDAATIAQAASVVDSLGDVYGQEGAVTLDDPAAALSAYERAQAIDTLGLTVDADCARCRRGVALEYWKMGMLAEAFDQEQAVADYMQGLETLAHFPAAEQATPRVLRTDTVTRQRLGLLLVDAGRADEGVRMLEAVHARFRAAVDADPTDARARFDLAALDASLADAYASLDRRAAVLAADKEYVEGMSFLVMQDPKNRTWRFHRADALLRYGAAQRAAGGAQTDKARGEKTQAEGLDSIVALAGVPEADVNMLDLAANALLDLRRDPASALEFAQRAQAQARHPRVDLLLTLSKAQRAAGHDLESRASALQALQLLALRPKSVGNAEHLKQARGLAHS